MRRHSRLQFHEPSLVPLADMLSNTVGIIVFILIFTVLTAGGAMVMKRMPLERQPNEKMQRAIFVCKENRLLLLDETLFEKFDEPFVNEELSYFNLDSYMERYRAHQVENEYFIVTGDVSVDFDVGRVYTTHYCKPKVSAGETRDDIKRTDARLHQFLSSRNPQQRYLYFIVYPDSQEIYKEAREIARTAGYQTGWRPFVEEKIGFGRGRGTGTD